MDARKLVGLNLRRIRVTKDVSQERLAFDAGVDRSYLGGVERGAQNPTVDVLEKLANTLDVDIRELFEQIDDDDRSTKGLPPGRKPNQPS